MPSRKKSKPNPSDSAAASSSSGRPSAVSLAATARSPESRSEPNLAATGRDGQAADTSGARESSSSQPEQKSTRISQSWYGGSPQPEVKASQSTPDVNATRPTQGGGRTNSTTSTPSKRASGLMPTAIAMRSQALTGTTKLTIGSPSSGKSIEIKDMEVKRKASEPSQLQEESKDVAQAKGASQDTVMKDAPPSGPEKQGPTAGEEKVDKPSADSIAQQSGTTSSTRPTESPQPAQGTWTSWFSRSQSKPPAAASEDAPAKKAASDTPEPKASDKSKADDATKAKNQSKPATATKAPERPALQTGQKLAAAAVAVVDPVKAVVAPTKVDSSSTKSQPEPTKPSPDQSKAQTDAKPTQRAGDARPASWFGLWTGAKTNGVVPEAAAKSPATLEATPTAETSADAADAAAPEKKKDSVDARKDPPVASQAAGSSSWAFWSRSPANTSNSNVGELAVAGSLSQSSPQRALDHEGGMPKALGSVQNRKRGRPDSLELGEDSRTSSAPPPQKKALDAVPKESISAATSPRPVSKREMTEANNLLLPLFKETYPMEPEKATLLQQMMQLFYGKPVAMRHPTLVRDPPRIKRALAIGIHGYFPIPLVQTVIGRPTGTSIKFAEHSARAIHKYTQAQGYTPASVEKIALEGEGRIEERLDTLWKLLLNWIEKIRHADFIILSCHSQGVPVAISLVAKLIGFGCVNGARIGICAMAGVNLGPFSEYRTRWIGGSAGELFEFARPDSAVSKGYQTALDTVLRFGGKVVYIGSMDDQLVSLQSSTFGSAQHPNIYRAVWVDGRVHIADFLTHLVGFALKLRNLGVSDHGLIRELSNPLAGSLVGGEGHSRLYEDASVYDLAIAYTAGTTSPNTGPLKIDRSPTATSTNPYILPFAMRGLLEEEFVRRELSSEILELVKKFDDWKPTTKVLKDVKYRLEGVRSKL